MWQQTVDDDVINLSITDRGRRPSRRGKETRR